MIEFEQGHAHVSVTFALGAASRFAGPDVPGTRDELVPLEYLWGRSGACLRDRVLEAGTPQEALSVMEMSCSSSSPGPSRRTRLWSPPPGR